MSTDLWSSLGSVFLVYRSPWQMWVLCCFTRTWFLKGRVSNLPSTLLFRETKLFLLPPVGNNWSFYLIHSNFDDTASQVFRWILGLSFFQYNFLLYCFRSCKVKIRDSSFKICTLCTLTQENKTKQNSKTPPYSTLALSKVLIAMQSRWTKSVLKFALPRQVGHGKPFDWMAPPEAVIC